jgi:hypothetical protein
MGAGLGAAMRSICSTLSGGIAKISTPTEQGFVDKMIASLPNASFTILRASREFGAVKRLTFMMLLQHK